MCDRTPPAEEREELRKIIEEGNQGYARLRADPEAWKQELEEWAFWERLNLEGLEEEDWGD